MARETTHGPGDVSDTGSPGWARKVEGPSTVLTFLGICLDTIKMEVQLPEDKLLRLQACIRSWEGKRVCIKWDLLSLLGLLHHAAKVVPPGRTLLRRMIDTSMLATQNHHHICLGLGFGGACSLATGMAFV